VRPTPTTSPVDLGSATGTLRLAGSLALSPRDAGAHADIAVYNDLAIIGTWTGACAGLGAQIIDVSDVSNPQRLGRTPNHANTSMEDMAALRIGERDVLAIGLQRCGQSPGALAGLELIDITDPANPRQLSVFRTDEGVHELNVTVTPDGTPLALLAAPYNEYSTFDGDYQDGLGDLLIIDLSDPTEPVLLSEWGVLGAPELGPDTYYDTPQGSFPDTLLHSVRANTDGTIALLSYWDVGVILLDISDPAAPRYLGRTTYSPDEEGNAHSTAITPDDQLLVVADEDFSPRKPMLTSSAFAGSRSGVWLPFTAPAPITGEIVALGRGCPADMDGGIVVEDAYVADPAGKVALIERGGCRLNYKVARAQQAGATAVIVANGPVLQHRPDVTGNNATVPLPDGPLVRLTIPALLVARPVAREIAAAPAPATIQVDEAWSGWGGLRFFDILDPANPQPLSTFLTPNAATEGAGRRGRYSAHNPEIVGARVYASWYSDGVRALDISDPRTPREIAAWTGEDAPDDAPPVDIWSVVPSNGYLFASDRNYGLYILEWQP
jgi:hypothetical protein